MERKTDSVFRGPRPRRTFGGFRSRPQAHG
jgi:hypothetical protein